MPKFLQAVGLIVVAAAALIGALMFFRVIPPVTASISIGPSRGSLLGGVLGKSPDTKRVRESFDRI